MADIYGRVRSLERKLNFVMTNLRMKAAIGTGLVDVNGKPQVRMFDGSLLELFHMSQQLPVIDVPVGGVSEGTAELPAEGDVKDEGIIVEVENG